MYMYVYVENALSTCVSVHSHRYLESQLVRLSSHYGAWKHPYHVCSDSTSESPLVPHKEANQNNQVLNMYILPPYLTVKMKHYATHCEKKH